MLTRVEVDTSALRHNIGALRTLVGDSAILGAVVKGNAYGHGTTLAAGAFVEAGADWLCVDAVWEAARLRDAGLDGPIYVMGYVGRDELEQAVALDCAMVLYDPTILELGAKHARALGTVARFAVKVETGNNRQGLEPDEALSLCRAVVAAEGAELEGVSSHFANIEDTTDHRYAREQMSRFEAFVARLRAAAIEPPRKHIANSAAALLWGRERGFDTVRTGIAAYGMWPSNETLVAALMERRGQPPQLKPALRWTCRVAQVKNVPAGRYIGYGCSFRTTHPTRLAILPVGYYDGYDRAIGNVGHVLIDGHRAPVRGRVCMNMMMVDVTDVPVVAPESEAVLLGTSGNETISAETLAGWANTINYEITTRIAEHIPRVAASEEP